MVNILCNSQSVISNILVLSFQGRPCIFSTMTLLRHFSPLRTDAEAYPQIVH